jgi:hypothetical protein
MPYMVSPCKIYKSFLLWSSFLLIITLFIHPQRLSFCEDFSIIIEDFKNNLFDTWLIRDASKRQASRKYKIKREKNKQFLRASSYNTSIQIAKKVKWDINSYPILTWQWRVHRLPRGANEARRGRNDSAAAIYVLFQRKQIPYLSWRYQPVNVIKYIWSSTLPVGRVVEKKKVTFGTIIYEGRFIVLESGNKKIGKWISEKRNVLKDYRRVFGKTPTYNPILIAILTDSNNTKSSAIADYDNIVIKKY